MSETTLERIVREATEEAYLDGESGVGSITLQARAEQYRVRRAALAAVKHLIEIVEQSYQGASGEVLEVKLGLCRAFKAEFPEAKE